MSDIANKVDAWLEPLDGAPCGDDLEYDAEFMEMSKAAEGKPETQFSSAEPPDWSQVGELAENLLGRTRDLRVAVLWGRSQLYRAGFSALPETLRLIHGWLDRYWDDVHPKPDADDGDLFARMNSLAPLDDIFSFLGDVRQSALIRSRSIGMLTVRDVEVALERIPPREDENAMSTSSVQQMLTDAGNEDDTLLSSPERAKGELEALFSLVDDKAGYGQAPQHDEIKSMLSALVRVMPSASGSGASDFDADSLLADLGGFDDSHASGRSSRSGGGGMGGSIDTRADAIRAIDLVCEFLERAEPTNPAQLMLRRAQKLIDKNFLELVRELAPESLNEVAKIMGIDPSTLEGGGY
jgi:type VI secretion system protein ImpA